MGALARREAARKKSVRAGVAALVAVILATVFAVTAQNGLPDYLPGVARTTIRAEFSDTGALRVGDDVRIANVRAGFVDAIDLVDGRPVVTMKLDDGDAVYADATAQIAARSSLGQKYVELYPGTPGQAVSADHVIPLASTENAVELDELLDTFDAKTREAAGTTLRQLGGGVGGRGGDLNDALRAAPDLLGDLGTVSEALATRDGADLTAMLEAAASLSATLQDQKQELAADTRQLADTLSAIATQGRKALDAIVTKAPEALASARNALQSLNRPLDATRVAATRLRPGAEALGRATPDLRALMRDAIDPLRTVPSVADQSVGAIHALLPAVTAAQETVPALRAMLAPLSVLLGTLAPYSPEVLDFFTNASSALAQGDAAGHWLRFYTVASPEIVSGSLPFRNPFTNREAYPAPGEARTHRSNTLLGGTQ